MSRRCASLMLLFILGLLSGFTPAVQAAVLTGEYKLPATIDSSVLGDRATELWARVWRPATGGPYPLVVLLHGNHSTCGRFDSGLGYRVDDNSQYTVNGTCPAGYVPVPSHNGYVYLAGPLAGRGYVVVSINADRGINAGSGVFGDSGLNLARGRMVLRHIEEIAKWNSGVVATPPSLGFSLQGMIDFQHVGLMGHSRGGEGMRAAMVQYQDPGSIWPAAIGTPVHFDGIFEIGPVDGQTSRVLNAIGVPWAVVLPGCDGDVSDLQGVRPFDRMMRAGGEPAAIAKATFEVFGANHNFYNVQWQHSDAASCDGQTPLFPDHPGSALQRRTASDPFLRFMQAHIGAVKHPGRALSLDPSYPVPSGIAAITQYSRGIALGPAPGLNLVVDDFDRPTGQSSSGNANQSAGLSTYSHGAAGASHDVNQRAASLSWQVPGGFLQLNAAPPGGGLNASSERAIEFRIALKCFGNLCQAAPAPDGDVDFSIALVNGDGTLSTPVGLKTYAIVRRPSGSSGHLNSVMRSVRIPLTAFIGAKLAQFHGVRFIFDRTAASSIYLANVRLDPFATGGGGPSIRVANSAAARVAKPAMPDFNRITAIRQAAKPEAAGAGPGAMEIELQSNRRFPVGDALPELQVGDRVFTLSRFAEPTQHGLVFTLTRSEYASLTSGLPVEVRVGGAPGWSFGALRKP